MMDVSKQKLKLMKVSLPEVDKNRQMAGFTY